MSRSYTKDHIAVIKVLGKDIPKRPSLSTQEICAVAFSNPGGNSDRAVRNAYRKLRKRDLVEIVERGMYRLTNAGVVMAKTIKDNGPDEFLRDESKEEKLKKVKKKNSKKKVKKKAIKKKSSGMHSLKVSTMGLEESQLPIISDPGYDENLEMY